ncbi:hypothetical protein AN958_07416 [Leucoagaricus sp. SymC.cos]|nr:hypothetical protein AN958_07416 [Leucoagaricus sp. SymC.cos]
MNGLAFAVLSGVLYFARGPAYPHPLPVLKPLRRTTHNGDNEDEDTPRLPPELYTLIASHLSTISSEDRQTLESCALVSSAWLLVSRKRLFGAVKLTYENVHTFLSLLEHPLCSFRGGMRVLKMREGEYMVDRWMNGVIPRLIDSLKRLRVRVKVLDIYDLTWAELNPTSARAMKEGWEDVGVESLRVGTCYFECVHEFVGFVCSRSFGEVKHLVCDYVLLNCPGVDECECGEMVNDDVGGVREEREALQVRGQIGVDGILFRNSSFDDLAGASLPKTLESLQLSLPEESMLRWFVDQDAVRGLKRLGVSLKEETLLPVVDDLVAKTDEALENLVLDLPCGNDFSLSHNTSLRSLHLHISAPDPDSNPSLARLISSISSQHLHTITFDIFYDIPYHSYGHDTAIKWVTQLGDTITPNPTITKVVFFVRYSRVRCFKALRRIIRDEFSKGQSARKAKARLRVRGAKVDGNYEDQWRREGEGEVWRSWIR